ncbi:hypothetical protein YPPY53_4659, partial [Yersinia pestis PY-53]
MLNYLDGQNSGVSISLNVTLSSYKIDLTINCITIYKK